MLIIQVLLTLVSLWQWCFFGMLALGTLTIILNFVVAIAAALKGQS